MSIDLDTTEGRKKYLSDKLDNLLDGINDSYGKLLLDELIIRLELTVKDFNEEMKVLVDSLVKKEKERQQILEMVKTSENVDLSEIAITSSSELFIGEKSSSGFSIDNIKDILPEA